MPRENKMDLLTTPRRTTRFAPATVGAFLSALLGLAVNQCFPTWCYRGLAMPPNCMASLTDAEHPEINVPKTGVGH
jgi:hypothetical protein